MQVDAAEEGGVPRLDDLLQAFPPQGEAERGFDPTDPPEQRFLEFPEFGDSHESYLDPNLFPDFEDPDA